MDILRFIGCINLKLIIFLVVTMLPEITHSSSIFDIILGNQPPLCYNLSEPTQQSIVGQGVFLPPVVSERLNFEYTIATPYFPLNYPLNIQCIFLIKAPSFDYHIILEVREKFDIEPSKNCLQDFLEITDGPYGFSKSIGKFCNSETLPKEIKSSGPFLWLRFKSDSNIPLTGFKIAYRFAQNTKPAIQRNYCYKQTMIPPGESFNFNTSFILAKLRDFAKIQDNTSIPLECVFDFYVEPAFKTYAYTVQFSKPTSPNPCSATNVIEIYNKNTFQIIGTNSGYMNYYKLCEETDFPKRLLKHSTRTTIRVITDDIEKINTMSIILTSVLYQGKCPPNYFLCSSKTSICISDKLKCNGEPNCPEVNDENCMNGKLLPAGTERNTTVTQDPAILKKQKIKEDEAKSQHETNKIHAIILGSIGSVLILSMLFCLLLTLHSKKKDKDIRRVNVVDVPLSNQDKPQNKNMFYELLQSSEPSVVALSTDKLSRKIYNDNQIWSKRPLNDTSSSSAPRNNNSNFKLNGGIKTDSTIRHTTNHPFKSKVDSSKGSSLNKIGKYLSVPNPAKNETTIKPIIPNKSCNQNQLFNIASPSGDFQSWSSNSFSKQNSLSNRSTHHIQRASSMGSGLRRKLQEPVNGDECSKNIEWYCGPVIRDNNIRNNSSEMLNAYSAKSSQHVPGCRSLPNFCNVGLQNAVYYTKPIPSDTGHTVTDLLDCSADDNSSYRGDTPTFSIQNHIEKSNMNKYPEYMRNDDDAPSHYGFKYFCAHDPISRSDFVEYIA